jgi:hypothetical protein
MGHVKHPQEAAKVAFLAWCDSLAACNLALLTTPNQEPNG